jgi:hypothetical protein
MKYQVEKCLFPLVSKTVQLQGGFQRANFLAKNRNILVNDEFLKKEVLKSQFLCNLVEKL